MRWTSTVLLLFMCGLTLGADIQLWSKCTNEICAYLYETPPCGLSVKVTNTGGLTLFQQPFDLAVSNEVCASFIGCNYCVELQNLTKLVDGSVHPCLYLKNSCDTKTILNLGCVTEQNDLGDCLTQGCPNGCSGHGDCSSTGACDCNSGWFGNDCSQQAPIFTQCVNLGPPYGDACLKLETEECAIDASIYLKLAPSTPLYEQLIEAPAFNTYFTSASCFNIAPNCGACIFWSDFVLNETYARGCPSINTSCTGVPPVNYAFDCFEDDALIPACFGSCPENCSSNGDCINGACDCDIQYTGSTCAIPKCDGLYNCYGNGECIAPNTCKCNDGYIGANCAGAVCDGVAGCSGHGMCIRPNVCRCYTNYTGSTCSESACPYDCKNGGQCSAGTCKCASGWQGADCGTKKGLTPGTNDHTPTSTYVVVGVVVGLVVAGAGGAGAFFVWRYKRTQRRGGARAFTAFDDGLIQAPDNEEDSQ